MAEKLGRRPRPPEGCVVVSGHGDAASTPAPTRGALEVGKDGRRARFRAWTSCYPRENRGLARRDRRPGAGPLGVRSGHAAALGDLPRSGTGSSAASAVGLVVVEPRPAGAARSSRPGSPSTQGREVMAVPGSAVTSELSRRAERASPRRSGARRGRGRTWPKPCRLPWGENLLAAAGGEGGEWRASLEPGGERRLLDELSPARPCISTSWPSGRAIPVVRAAGAPSRPRAEGLAVVQLPGKDFQRRM